MLHNNNNNNKARSSSMKELFESDQKKSIEAFFKNPNLFNATFLIGRREVSFSDSMRIYNAIEKDYSSSSSSSSYFIPLLSEMILNAHRNKEYEYGEKLFKEKLMPLLLFNNKQLKSLKEYSWNRLFACFFIFKNCENLVFLYKKLKSECPNVVLNERNYKNLLNLFTENNESDFAIEILDSIKKPTLIDYSLVIKSLSKEGKIQQAIFLISRMEEMSKLMSDAIIFIPLIKSCIEFSLENEGFQIISMIRERNLSSPLLVTTIINFYFHFNRMELVLSFLSENRNMCDHVTYGRIIQNLVKRGETKEAISFIENYMLKENLVPDEIALLFLIKNCEEEEGKHLYRLMVENEMIPQDSSINIAMICFYSKLGDWEKSLVRYSILLMIQII